MGYSTVSKGGNLLEQIHQLLAKTIPMEDNKSLTKEGKYLETLTHNY